MEDLDLVAESKAHALSAFGIDVDKLYQEMSTLEVKIDLTMTPDIMYVNRKMVEIREASQKAQRIYLKIQRALGANQKWSLNLEATLEILTNSKLENDAEVKAGQTIADRQAIASNKLVQYKRAIREAKSNCTLLSALTKAINLCIKNIDKTDADVKQQAKLMESQMRNLKTQDPTAASRTAGLSQTESDMAELEQMAATLDASAITAIVGSDDSAELTVSSEEDEVSLVEEAVATEDSVQEVALAEQEIATGVVAPQEELSISVDDDIVLDPGLTGAPQHASEPELTVDEGDLTAFLGNLPEVSAKDTKVLETLPSSEDGADTSSEVISVDADDTLFSNLLDDVVGDGATDVGPATVVVDDGDVFGGLVDTSTATEQRPPKLVRDELEREKLSKPAAPAPAKPAVVAPKAATPPPVVAAPKPAVQEPQESLDDLLNDLLGEA
jgi:hypothetical protein